MKRLVAIPVVLLAMVAIAVAVSQDETVNVVDVNPEDSAFPQNPKDFVIDEGFYMPAAEPEPENFQEYDGDYPPKQHDNPMLRGGI